MSIISSAYAAGGAGQPNDIFQLIFMFAIVGAVFYFLVYRPQSKRAKEHESLITSIEKGDEVLTAGGIAGKVATISAENEYVVLKLDETSKITIKKDYIVASLPKGTIQSL